MFKRARHVTTRRTIDDLTQCDVKKDALCRLSNEGTVQLFGTTCFVVLSNCNCNCSIPPHAVTS
jgi:hypothetical protein